MPRTSTPNTARRVNTWRAFADRDARAIAAQVDAGKLPTCPGCAAALEAAPGTRLERSLPLDAVGYDLECRGCRRFHAVAIHTERSLRLLAMRRLVAAVQAPAPKPARRRTRASAPSQLSLA
jgi:hypothetical protein